MLQIWFKFASIMFQLYFIWVLVRKSEDCLFVQVYLGLVRGYLRSVDLLGRDWFRVVLLA